MSEDEVDYHYRILTAGQWRCGQCDNCFTPHPALVMLCTQCRIGCCDDSVCDPCYHCGLPFCNDCFRSHNPCDADVLVKYRPELQCRHCHSAHDIGTGTCFTRCMRCLQACCSSRQHCRAQVHTPHCGCRGDLCGDCAYWRGTSRTHSLVIPATQRIAVVPRPGPRRYVCRRCFPTGYYAD